ncbi:MAG: hypothetical protein M3N47_13305 [Chloroflexota bacterium]|nr:hypothetical protein [Chloroflexota bacterium]
MYRLRHHRPRHATVVAYLALFVALGGTSYAVAKGSIGSREIKNNSVQSADIRNGTLTARDIRRSTLKQLRGAPGAPGATGAPGPPGPQGRQGPAGTVDTSNFYTKRETDSRYLRGTITVIGSSDSVGPGTFGVSRVQCPDGYQAIGGGVDPHNVKTMVVTSSAPAINGVRTIFHPDGQNPAANGWQGSVRNNDTTPLSFKVVVICAPIG